MGPQVLLKNGMKRRVIIIVKMIKKTILLFLVIFCLTISVYALNIQTVYNPFTGKLDYIRNTNFSGNNVTADYLFGNLSWDNLYNYPIECPGGTAITQLDDSVVCTQFAQYQFTNNNFNGSGNFTTSGRIGIGTETPTYHLSVEGDETAGEFVTVQIKNSKTGGGDDRAQLILQSEDRNKIIFNNHLGTEVGNFGWSSGIGQVLWFAQGSGTSQLALTALGGTSYGFIGIGTTAPESRLHIARLEDDSKTSAFKISDESGTGMDKILVDFSSQGTSNDLGVFYFNGDLGINTISPTQVLDVNGSVNISGGNDLYVSEEEYRYLVEVPKKDAMKFTSDEADKIIEYLGEGEKVPFNEKNPNN